MKSEGEGNIIQRRPAEIAGPVAMAIAGLLCKLIGVEDPDTILYLAVVVAFVPMAVTWIVNLVRS